MGHALRVVGKKNINHFVGQGPDPKSYLDLLRAKLIELKNTGHDTPEKIAAGLNESNVRTACGEEWTTKLAAHLWRLTLKTEPPQAPKPRVPLRPNGGDKVKVHLGRFDRPHPSQSRVPNIDTLLKSVLEMSAIETVALWRNALKTIATPSMKDRHPSARLLVRAVQDEWERREQKLNADEDGFPWPSTRAVGRPGTLVAENWLAEGLLKFMGYAVGSTAGEPDAVRHQLLAAIFDGPVPPVFPRDYMRKWSRPGTPARLRQLAETLAAFVRNGKRRDAMASAVEDWEADLDFLFHEFYRGKFGFGWPRTRV